MTIGDPGESCCLGWLGSTEDVQMKPSEIIFEVTEAVEGGYDAKALGHNVFTQGKDWNDLKAIVRDAVRCHFNDENIPRVIRLHPVRSENRQ